jgi:hypothetical protein
VGPKSGGGGQVCANSPTNLAQAQTISGGIGGGHGIKVGGAHFGGSGGGQRKTDGVNREGSQGGRGVEGEEEGLQDRFVLMCGETLAR